MKNENALAAGSVGKLLLKLAIPAVSAQIINVLYNIVDRIYIGHIEGIGTDALTGVGVTMPLIILISAFSYLVGMGGAPKAAIAMGEGDNARAEKILGGCATMLVFLSVVLTAVFLIFGRGLLLAFGASENTISYAHDYFFIYTIGTVAVQLALGLNPFVTTQGHALTGMLTVLIGAVLNIVLDPLFIFAFDLGVKGAAIATVISQAVSAVWVVIFLCRKPAVKIRLRHLLPDFKIVLPCLVLGISPFIMQATESALFVCFNTSLKAYGGDVAVCTMTVLSSVMSFSMQPLNGITQGAQPIISYNYGAGNYERVRKAFKLQLIACVAYTTLLWLTVMLFPALYARIFTDDTEVIAMTSWALRVYMAVSCIFSLQIGCQQTFIALGKAGISIFLALLRKVILLIPLIYILPLLTPDKVFGVFLAEPVADTVAVLTTVTCFALFFRKLPKKNKLPAAIK